MRIRRGCHSPFEPRIGRLKLVLLCLFTILLSFLHLVLLPSATGGYNDECLTPDWKRQILRAMVQNISRAFDKFNVKYWIDYGKLYVLVCVFASKDVKKTLSNFSVGDPVSSWVVCVFSADQLAQLIEYRSGFKPWPDQHSGSLNN